MSKIILTPSYIFNPIAKTLDLSKVTNFNISNLYAVINNTSNQTIYAVGVNGFGITNVNNGILSLVYNTASMHSTDSLFILYDADTNNTTTPVSGSVSVSNFPSTQSISGSVSVSNLPSTQPVSGTIAVSNFPASTSVSNFPATQPVSGSVSVSNLPATQPVSGTFWQSTQPVSGPLTDTQLRASTVPISGTVGVSNFPVTQPVSGPLTDTQLRASTVPISGTVTGNQGSANTIGNAWSVKLTDGTTTATVNSNGSLTVAGVSSVGNAPVNPPIAVSGTDGGGLKRHLLTNTDGSIVVAGRTVVSTVTPTITASSAYTAGNEVGGLMTFTSAVNSATATGVIQSIKIVSKSVQTTSFKLYLFNVNPSNTTWTDKTAPSVNASDVASVTGMYLLNSPDSGLGTHTLYNLDSIGKCFTVASGTTLYGVLVCTATPTFSSTSDITVSINIIQD